MSTIFCQSVFSNIHCYEVGKYEQSKFSVQTLFSFYFLFSIKVMDLLSCPECGVNWHCDKK